jgi:hypothetical protein
MAREHRKSRRSVIRPDLVLLVALLNDGQEAVELLDVDAELLDQIVLVEQRQTCTKSI